MTTDFVVTVRHPVGDVDEPHTVKYTKDLSNRRTLEKREIERRYWQARNKRLKILTEENVPLALMRIEVRFELPPGTSLAIARYLIANRYVNVDMRKRINPCEVLRIVD